MFQPVFQIRSFPEIEMPILKQDELIYVNYRHVIFIPFGAIFCQKNVNLRIKVLKVKLILSAPMVLHLWESRSPPNLANPLGSAKPTILMSVSE